MYTITFKFSSEEHANEFALWATSTKDNTPRHIWRHAIELAATRLGVGSDIVEWWSSRIDRDYWDGASAQLTLSNLVSIRDARKESPASCHSSVSEHLRGVMAANLRARMRALKGDSD